MRNISFIKFFFSFFLLLMFFSTVSFSQSMKTLLKNADRSMAEHDYFAAAQYYGKAMQIDSTTLDIQWKYAEASRLNYDFDEAKHWYDNVLKLDNMKNYPLAPYRIGIILQFKAQYKDSKKYFDKYFKKFKNSKDPELKRLALRAKMYYDACDFALLQMKNPLPFSIDHLDTNINSKLSEYAPYEFDTVFYFSSLRNKSDRDNDFGLSFNKLYTAQKKSPVEIRHMKGEDDEWRRAFEFDSLFNKNGIHNANISFNKDFSQVYISRCKQINANTFNCKIYLSEKKNGVWSDPEELPSPVNITGFNTTQPNISEINGVPVLFFASNRGGGEGGLDIWYSLIEKDGSFGNPVNAGNKINSPEDEITPFFVGPTQTLYFSSTWHKGLGGFDIFKTEYKNKSFSVPQNAGYPINSSQNDIYYSLNSKRDKVYISSNRTGAYFEEKPNCCNDIFAFSVPPIEEPLPPVDTSKLLVDQLKILCPLTLYFHNDEPNPKTTDTITKKTYKKTYDEYLALRPAYLKEFPKGREGSEKELAETRITAFMEDSVDAGMNDLEKFALLLEEVLKRNEKVKITMKGYCSPLASTDYNIHLAKRRVSSLRNYFMEYKSGMFMKYINNTNSSEGRIEFFEEDVGELPTSKVSDDVKDKQNSVYSPGAARERKIQILAVSSIN